MEGFLENFIDILEEAVYIIPVILVSLTLHEFAHAWTSYKLGDFTAKSMGRLTLNPLVHLDPLGTVMLLISSLTGFGFGWAKPVPIVPMYYKNRKLGCVLVSLAGPMTNLLIAFVAEILYVICSGVVGVDALMQKMAAGNITFEVIFCTLMLYFVYINIGLAVFNMLPVPPLDGSKILGAFLPERAYFKMLEYERYISILFVLIILLRSEWLDAILDPCFMFVYNILITIVEPLYNLFM